MLDTLVQTKIRELVAMTRDESVPMNLRVVWAKLAGVLGQHSWPDDTREELEGISSAFEKYIGKLELAKFGHGAPPPEAEYGALVDRIRGLERLLPGPEPGGVPA